MTTHSGFYSTKQAMSSLDDTWTTPKDYFDKLNAEFNFVLDAAALQSSALCVKWYGPDNPLINKQDAFSNDWAKDADGGYIYLNPPYGKTIKKWMAKANYEFYRGAKIVCLVPARTDTAWWHESVIHHKVRFIKGRLKFGNSKNAAPFPSAIVVMD